MTCFTAMRRHNLQRHPGIVAFAVARRAFDHRIVICHAGLLRSLRNIVDIGAERDHRLAFPHVATNAVGMPAMLRSHFESFFFEDADEIFRGLELLKTQLAETEDAVHHHLRLFLHAVDLAR